MVYPAHTVGVLTVAAVALNPHRVTRVGGVIGTRRFPIVGTRVWTAVRGRFVRHLHLLPLSFHNRSRSGDLVSASSVTSACCRT